MYDKNRIEDSLEFVRQMKEFMDSDDALDEFDPFEDNDPDELFVNLAYHMEPEVPPKENVVKDTHAMGDSFGVPDAGVIQEQRRLAGERLRLEQEEARRKQAEQEQQRRLAEERRRLEEEAAKRRQAEQEQQRQLAEERRRLEEEAAKRRQAEQERQRQLEEERRRLEEEAAKRRQAEQEQQRRLEEERRRMEQEAERRRQAELQEKQRQEVERKKIEEERKRLAEEQKRQEEARRQWEEERRQAQEEAKRREAELAEKKRLEEERQRLAQEEARRKEAELAEKKRLEEERQRLAQEEARRKEAELAEKKRLEEERQRLAQEEARRKEAELAEKKRLEEERKRLEQEAQRRRQAELQEKQRQEAERLKIEEERRRLAEEQKRQEQVRRQLEQERQRLVEEQLQRELEEQRRILAEKARKEAEEKAKKEAEEKERRRKLVQEEEQRKKELQAREEEQRRKAQEEEKKKEEQRLAAASQSKQNTETPDSGAEKTAGPESEVERLRKRAEELKRQAEMATLEARMRQLQLEAEGISTGESVIPPQADVAANGMNGSVANSTSSPAVASSAATTSGSNSIPMPMLSIPGVQPGTMAANTGQQTLANNQDAKDKQKLSKEEIDSIFANELKRNSSDSSYQQRKMMLQKQAERLKRKREETGDKLPLELVKEKAVQAKEFTTETIWKVREFVLDKMTDPENAESREKAKKIMSNILVILICIAVAFMVSSIVTNFVAHPTKVEGESMETTLTDGDTVIIQKLSYYFGTPDRYDVVVFPIYNSETYYIKRVIGLPGETIQIEEGKVFINGKELKDDIYGKDEFINDPGDAGEPITLASDEYFVLGDNRNMSTDSRSSYVGVIKKKNIAGKAWRRVLPFSKAGKVK